MRTNAQGLTIIRDSESCELEAYPDPGSALYRACQRARINPLRGGYRKLKGWESIPGDPWTIGFGDTGPDVGPGLVITEVEADTRLARRLETEFEPGVERLLRVPVTGNQCSALVSFAYNVGLQTLADSSLLRLLNSEDYEGAAAQFARWTRSGGRVLPGLVTRREAERLLFLTQGDGDPA